MGVARYKIDIIYYTIPLVVNDLDRAREEVSSQKDSTEESKIHSDRFAEAIVKALQDGPLNAGDLAKRSRCAPQTFYDHLRPLLEEREIIQTKEGRHVWYALAKHEADLFKKRAKGIKRTGLEQHVRKNALIFLDDLFAGDYLVSDPDHPFQHDIIQDKNKMLYQAVVRLKSRYQNIPMLTKYLEGGKYPDEGLSPTLLYRYWIDVLVFLGEL